MLDDIDMHEDSKTPVPSVTPKPWPDLHVVEPGTVLFREGSAAADVCWIIDGVVKLTSHQTDQSRPSANRGPACEGDFLGVTLGLRRGASLLGPFTAWHPRAHASSAIAVHRTRLFRFAAHEFRERLADPGFMEHAQHAMSRALLADLQDDTRAFLRDPRGRLVAVLSTLVDERATTTGGCVSVWLPPAISSSDLAALLQVTPSELAQLLDDWSRRGYVRTGMEGVTFCWTSLTHAARRTSSSLESFSLATFSSGAMSRALPEAHRPTPPASQIWPTPTWTLVTPSSTRCDARMTKALALIEGSYADEAFDMRELSRHVNLSPWHLSRLLKGATRMTFRQLRNRVRIEHARVALLSTHLSVKEIAARVGYTHASDLTRHFRATHHQSPTAYRAWARAAAANNEPHAHLVPGTAPSVK